MATVQGLAKAMVVAFKQDTRTNGDSFYLLDDDTKAEWMTDVIRTAHGDAFPDDTIYELIYDAVSTLSDADGDADEDDLREVVYEMEPDIYTHKLTGWLHARTDHIGYLDEALSEFGAFTSATYWLQAAQKLQMDEVGIAVLDALIERVASHEDEEDASVTE